MYVYGLLLVVGLYEVIKKVRRFFGFSNISNIYVDNFVYIGEVKVLKLLVFVL